MLRHLDNVIEDYRQHVNIVKEKLRGLATSMIDSCVSQVILHQHVHMHLYFLLL